MAQDRYASGRVGSDAREVEDLAAELRRAVGWGISSRRMAAFPLLLATAGVSPDDNLSKAAGVVRALLSDSISNFDSAVVVHGNNVPVAALRRALMLLLRLEGSGQDAVNRRTRAMLVLGVYGSVDAWRQPDGPEHELLRELARHLLRSASNLQTDSPAVLRSSPSS